MFTVSSCRSGDAEGSRTVRRGTLIDRSTSEYDFVSGPLAAAIEQFRYFDHVHETLGPAVRTLVSTDPFFGAVVFVGVLVDTDVVEIADFEDDPDYWSIVDPLT